MLISYSHRFIFIHVYKTAGKSIREALKKYAQKSPEFGGHITANELSQELPSDVYDNFFKFAFVRNPWDLQVSLYSFMLQNKRHRQHELIKSMANFDEYLDWRVTKDMNLQSDFIVNSNGNVIVDFVGKFENLRSDFSHISETIGIKAKLSHLNKSRHKDYRRYYTQRTIDLVNDKFLNDIDLFDYSF